MNNNIKNCLTCGKEIHREDSPHDYAFKIKKFCSVECRHINDIVRIKGVSNTYAVGLYFELTLKKKLENDGWVVFKTEYPTKLLDLIAFKGNEVMVIQAKTHNNNPTILDKLEELKNFKRAFPNVTVKLITKEEDYEIKCD
ncbi:MAG: hypothetical protein Sv326_0435 [Candidatus Fermentimicrarchaeum limneticum]|uniref:Restriction endonuclease type IV Mrr domain-containing protein n=1 Tax=Fermentimicrarchaeum limneticum TaxID=2795018 RepID=A0A7D5XEL1_FERL1|nr:MAG: hypothetical protein Sv326_0361 [Candidatus Fermentimicrarchaeum limneticum]QLJ52573.1 MAG: hypothetical protein Sv326_0398 [Candidatus Fermentimicrarchaeum limneticum]QLJ52610.1 MAG: hypothetical protein Sv326_0435 [Candidatus Fermentimicrarchaeum limneticum]